jgi:hypothetical protein
MRDIKKSLGKTSSDFDASNAHEYWREGAKAEFESVWDSINFKRGLGWEINPWVWCISFRKV